MKPNFLILILCLIMFPISAVAMGIGASRTRASIEAVTNASYWFVEKGAKIVYGQNEIVDLRKGMEFTGAYPYSKPAIDMDGILLSMLIQHSWMESKVVCVDRFENNDAIYEYWIFLVYSGRRADVDYRKATFLITKTKELLADREIIKEGTTIIGPYEIKPGTVLEFPRNNENLIHWIKPWNFPEAFGKELSE